MAQRTDAEILADIAAAKEDFLTARYGRDVRNAMGSLAQGVYDALEYFDETPHYKGALSDPDLNALKSDEIYSLNMSGDIDFQPRPVNVSGVCMLLCLGSGGSTCYQVLFASGGRTWSRRYLSTSSSWTAWAQIGLQPSGVTITAANKGDYFDDANDAPTNSIYRVTSAAHIENTPYGDGMTAATGDYDGNVRNIKKYANGTLMTFGSDNSLKTQIFIHDTTRPIMYYRVYYSGYEEGKRWGEWMAVSSKISPTSTNVAIRAKLVAPYLDSGGNPTMTDTGTPNDEFVDDPMFFSDMNDAPNNSIYQIDKDLKAEFMAHNPHPGTSSVLITTGFSWSSKHGKIQFCVGTDDGETFFATRYGYQNTATQYIWTPWLNVVDAEAVESLRSLIYEGRSTEANKPHIMTWFTYGSGTELSLQSMPKWSQTYALGAELKALVGSYFPDPASLRDTTPYLVEKTAMLSSQDAFRYKISTYDSAFQWEGYSRKNAPRVILWTKTVFPVGDSESPTLSWEQGRISTETGNDVSSAAHVRSSRIRTDGYSAFTLDSETVGMFYVYEYSRDAFIQVNQCVPGEVYELSETAYAVRITFALNPQAEISPNTEDATKVAGGRTRIIFADTAAYKAYENRMGYPVPGWQNGNLVVANGYYSTASHYSGSLASYPLPIGKAGKIFLKSIDQFLVFAVFQYNRDGQLLAPPTSNLKENAAVDVLEDAYCYRVTAHYPPTSDDPSKWPDITPKAAGCDRVTLLTGPSLFSMQAWTMYDVLRDAETEKPGPMLTIIDDDGNAKFYTDVLPIVQEEHVPIACAFITGKPGPTDNHMTWEQVEEANRSGAEILCHTYNHWSGDDISGKSKHDMSDEYRKAKFTLEQHGVQSNLLVYSGSTGLYSQSNKGAAAAGFKGAFLAGDDVSNVRGSIDPFRIKRYRIGSDYAWNFNTLKTLLDSLVSNGGWMVWMMHTSDAKRWTDGTGDTPDAKAVLREVCRYAKTLNIEIVTAEAGFHAYCE